MQSARGQRLGVAIRVHQGAAPGGHLLFPRPCTKAAGQLLRRNVCDRAAGIVLSFCKERRPAPDTGPVGSAVHGKGKHKGHAPLSDAYGACLVFAPLLFFFLKIPYLEW